MRENRSRVRRPPEVLQIAVWPGFCGATRSLRALGLAFAEALKAWSQERLAKSVKSILDKDVGVEDMDIRELTSDGKLVNSASVPDRTQRMPCADGHAPDQGV